MDVLYWLGWIAMMSVVMYISWKTLKVTRMSKRVEENNTNIIPPKMSLPQKPPKNRIAVRSSQIGH